MSRATRKLRRGLVAVTAAGLLASVFGVGPANAIGSAPAGSPTVIANSEPDVFRSETAPAGNITIASDTAGSALTVINGEQLVLEVDDNAGLNCTGLTSAQYIGFASLPTVTVNAGPGVEIDATLRSSSIDNAITLPPCQGFLPTVQDQLVLTVTQAPVGGGTIGSIVISGIQYNVGSLAATGDVIVNSAVDNDPAPGYEQDPFAGTVSNAYVTNAQTTVGPAVAIQPGAGRTAPTVTLRETTPDAFTPTGTNDGICIELVGGNVVDFVAPAPTVTVSPAPPAGDSAGPAVVLDDDTIRIPVTRAAAAVESTLTVSGIKVNTQAGNFGPQLFEIHQCAPDGTHLPITPEDSETAYTNPDNERVLVVVVRAIRFAGLDRFETAQVIAENTFGCSNIVVLARGDLFPDALAGNYVAGVEYAPILLTNTNSVPESTLESIRRLGATDILIMGGTAAVSDAVAQQLDGTTSYECGGAVQRRTPEDQPVSLNFTRLAGVDRFGTARAAAAYAGVDQVGTLFAPDDTDAPLNTAILANGLNFPDALAAGPMAFQGCDFTFFNDCGNGAGFPLLLSNGQSATLPPATESALSQENIQQVIIVGGTAAVPASIEALLESRGINVIRLAGTNRQETAVEIAEFELDALNFGQFCCFGFEYENVSLARGDDFADALTMGPHAGAFAHELLLTESPSSLGSATAGRLAVVGQLGVFELHIAGGTAAVSDAVVNAALAALGGV